MPNLQKRYLERFEVLEIIAKDLTNDLENHLQGVSNIDRISARAKSVDRFIEKANIIEDGEIKYPDPWNQIQDQVGARITCYYLSDVDSISKEILRYYRPIEKKQLIPESVNEFGYVGEHFILHVPSDIIPEKYDEILIPNFFELQIKTLFQHAWSEASHDLAYKPTTHLSTDQKRKIAFTAAQSWGADMIFEELKKELN